MINIFVAKSSHIPLVISLEIIPGRENSVSIFKFLIHNLQKDHINVHSHKQRMRISLGDYALHLRKVNKPSFGKECVLEVREYVNYILILVHANNLFQDEKL